MKVLLGRKETVKIKMAEKKLAGKKIAKILACRICLVAPYSNKNIEKQQHILVLYIKFRALFSTIPQ